MAAVDFGNDGAFATLLFRETETQNVASSDRSVVEDEGVPCRKAVENGECVKLLSVGQLVSWNDDRKHPVSPVVEGALLSDEVLE